METKLFTNTIMVNSSTQTAKTLLENVQNILKWDYEIVEVTPIGAHKFKLYRKHGALNQQEIIKVEVGRNEVSYVSTMGKVEYRVVWTIDEVNATQTSLSQTLYLEKSVLTSLAKVISSVVQNAFAGNLKVLKHLCELEEVA